MKSLFKKVLTTALVATSVVTFASCGGDKETPTQGGGDVVSYSEYSLNDFKAYIKLDLDLVLASCGDKDQYSSSVWNNIMSKYEAGKAAINAAASKSGKKYGLFSLGARNEANRLIRETKN